MEPALPKTCPRCRQEFRCGLADGEPHCWCFDCPRVLPVIENAGCLCPTCLETAIAENKSHQEPKQIPDGSKD